MPLLIAMIFGIVSAFILLSSNYNSSSDHQKYTELITSNVDHLSGWVATYASAKGLEELNIQDLNNTEIMPSHLAENITCPIGDNNASYWIMQSDTKTKYQIIPTTSADGWKLLIDFSDNVVLMEQVIFIESYILNEICERKHLGEKQQNWTTLNGDKNDFEDIGNASDGIVGCVIHY